MYKLTTQALMQDRGKTESEGLSALADKGANKIINRTHLDTIIKSICNHRKKKKKKTGRGL